MKDRIIKIQKDFLKFEAICKREKILRSVYGIDFLNYRVLVNITGLYEWRAYKKLLKVSEFTDRNERQIVEGDVIEVSDFYWVVCYGYDRDKQGIGWTAFTVSKTYFSYNPQSADFIDYSVCSGEVIDNIFVNKEFLKQFIKLKQ